MAEVFLRALQLERCAYRLGEVIPRIHAEAGDLHRETLRMSPKLFPHAARLS